MHCSSERHAFEGSRPPFRRLLVLDWYDGVVSSIGECAACHASLSLSMVAWRPDTSDRVYFCRSLQREGLDQACAGSTPTWPFWVPRPGEIDDEALVAALAGTREPSHLVATTATQEQVLASMQTTEPLRLQALTMVRASASLEGARFGLVDLEVATAQTREQHAAWFRVLGL